MSDVDDWDNIADENIEQKVDKTEIESLSEKLSYEKDARLEERFLWILLVVILFDAHIFTQMESWGGSISITVLELFGLLGAARKCGVDYVEILLDRFVEGWKSSK